MKQRALRVHKVRGSEEEEIGCAHKVSYDRTNKAFPMFHPGPTKKVHLEFEFEFGS